jgi:hypothetical protein
MMDGKGTVSDPIIITTGCNLDREFYPDGTPRNHRDAEPRRSRRTPQQADAMITDDHRPHFVDSDRSASELARQQRIFEDSNAWRGPQASPPATTADAAPPQGVTAAEWARHQMIQDQANAWRPKDAYSSDPYTGSPTRPAPKVPLGAYPLSAGEGNQCSVNGAAGHLVKEGNFLVCRADASDAAVGTRDAVDAAWNAMVTEQSEAWRKQG